MTKQAFSQLRQKISPQAFVELNDDLVTWLYDDDSYKKFRGYRLLAIDGSITEIPDTTENREYFGYYHNQSDRQQARSMVSVIYDVENDFIMESKICSWCVAERDVAQELIERLGQKGHKHDLYLFDRGYPSKDMVSFLEKRGLKYVIRVKTDKFYRPFDEANEPDQVVAMAYGGHSIPVRVVNVPLESGATEKLITNLFEAEYRPEDFKSLYFKRWGIESKYSELKSRYELENFSGRSPIAIEQDFYAAIYLSNMLALAKQEANEAEENQARNRKYAYKVNTNILIAKMMPLLVAALAEDNPKKQARKYNKAMSAILRNLIPIRPNRSFPRREPSRKNKFPINKKRNR